MALSLGLQFLAVAVAILQRQLLHNEAAARQNINPEYDYIVVGAGSAGSIVATKLAQFGQRVLLLEAGGAMNVIQDIPSAFLLASDATNDWGYSTVPQKYSQQMWSNKQAPYPLGKVIGGTSSVNFMSYARGNPLDFDDWANKYGCGEEWSYKALLPYFRNIETFANVSNFPGSEKYHGRRGPVGVSLPMHRDPIHERFMMAWNLEGFPTIDVNAPDQNGVAILPSIVDPFHNWFRSGAAQAYLYPNLNRSKLHIYAYATVTKVIFKGDSKIAAGVEFVRNGQTFLIKACKEVILSAGAINTPKILMLSGIGPRKDLLELRIPPRVDLPVGRQLKDHVLLTLSFLANNESLIDWGAEMVEKVTRTPESYQFWLEKTGPLTARGFTFVYYPSKENPVKTWPNTAAGLYITQIGEQSLETYKASTNYTAWANYFRPLVNDQRYFEVIVALFRHHSTGSVKLRSSNPSDSPLIDPNFFSDPRDLPAIVDLMARTYKTTESEYFRKYAKPYRATIPGCEAEVCRRSVPLSKCPAYLACVARMKSQTCWAPGSTAPMGNHDMAVLDPDLRVKGIEKLRVIDASALPEPTNGLPMAPVMALARKAVDIILAEEFNKGHLKMKWSPLTEPEDF